MREVSYSLDIFLLAFNDEKLFIEKNSNKDIISILIDLTFYDNI
jgi:hypothetical protein